MNSQAIVGVVIPAWNAAPYLAETIRSVQSQTLARWELVVVDDASSDETKRIADSYAQEDSRIRVIGLPRNCGQSVARNTGLEALGTSSSFVLFLDADDLLVPEALEGLHDALVERPDAIGVHGWVTRIGESGEPLTTTPEPQRRHEVFRARGRWSVRPIGTGGDTTFGALCVVPYLTTPGQVLVRRESLDLLGPSPWRESATFWSDTDLWLRLARLGPFSSWDGGVLLYRVHAASITARTGHDMPALERLHLLDETAETETEREMMRVGWRAADRMWARTRCRWGVASLRSLRPVDAAKHFRHAVRAFAHSWSQSSARTGKPVHF